MAVPKKKRSLRISKRSRSFYILSKHKKFFNIHKIFKNIQSNKKKNFIKFVLNNISCK